jgi:AraC-like DNA-binding protein
MQIFRNYDYSSGFTYADHENLPAMTHCGEATYTKAHSHPPHLHPGFEFVYLSRGTSTRYEGSHQTRLRMGDVYVVYPNEMHSIRCEPDEEGHQLWVGLWLDKLGPEGAALLDFLMKRKRRLLNDCYVVEPILQGIVRQVVDNRPQRSAVIHAYLRTFCSLLQQAAQGTARERASTSKAWPYTLVVRKAVTCMERNLDRRLTLAELVSAAGAANPSRFCTLFHEEVKVTPAAYHLQLRLAAARRALVQPSSSVTTVAMEHGFGSTQHFCGAFRRAFGVTATAWKKCPNS